MRLVIGMGCDRGASLESLTVAVDLALAQIGQERESVVALATIDKKSDEESLLALAADEGWQLHFCSAGELAKVAVPNPSAVVMKYMGTPAVAEAAAILVAGSSMERLLVEKYKYLGSDGKNVTVSIIEDMNEKR